MSVILGYKSEDKIYLGADNRTVTTEDAFLRDNVRKILAINNDVAVAFAGCYKSQMLFEMKMKRFKNNMDFRVEDALKCIKWIYKFCKVLWFKNFSKEILSIGSQFIVAGKNKKGDCCIYVVIISKGKLIKPLLKEWFIFPPYGADMDECCNIYIKNITKYPNSFVQRTIKNIAKNNKYISSSGDIWTYDIKLGRSSIEHFD